ncbi:MAG: hypothetical protein ABIJ95_07105 [Pseudomonadota bacterium]
MSFDPPCDTFVACKCHFVEILSHDPGNYLGEGTRASLETGRVWTYGGEQLDWVAGQMFAAQHRPAIYRLLRRFLDAEAESAQVDAAVQAEWRKDMEGRR